MGFTIIGTIIGMLIGYSINYNYQMFVLWTVLGACWGQWVWIMAGIPLAKHAPVIEVISEQPLCPLSGRKDFGGNIKYLYIGSENNDEVYRYVVKIKNGKALKEVTIPDVRIREGAYTPTVVSCEYKFKKPWYNWFVNNIYSRANYVEFRLPSEAITKRYDVDLEYEDE